MVQTSRGLPVHADDVQSQENPEGGPDHHRLRLPHPVPGHRSVYLLLLRWLDGLGHLYTSLRQRAL